MPLFEYQCVDCQGRDQRVAGLDDHTAACAECGGLMLRLDEDVFAPYGATEDRGPETETECTGHCQHLPGTGGLTP
ncbi:MAG: hypothetical protein M1438_03140 [Deltaproteobacteria bacterium]|nr:hypothetical protein [Deltaproteobacteria bacterium]